MKTKFKIGSKIKVVSAGVHMVTVGAQGVIVDIDKSPCLGTPWFWCEFAVEKMKLQQILLEEEIDLIEE